VAEAHPRQIELYVTSDGSSPFEEWLSNLKDRQARVRIRIRLERLRLGNFGDCKFVGSGIFELRVDYGPGYRVYFGQQGDALVILLCGGDKKSQAADIKNANKFWEDYRARQDDESE
jgi:putative addiction module killer protein